MLVLLQPPSGGCVLKPTNNEPIRGCIMQPPSGGCVLKHFTPTLKGSKRGGSHLRVAVC